ncbi:MAG: SCP2 sterol-binding domain-containing protein [Gammaproteobacteria bacterium]|jgi:ubiquinone biosynthesis protein UbiJ|nr:SCP2 sterol-binding domain-containing protein [Gammaproteobacteria bacterium]
MSWIHCILERKINVLLVRDPEYMQTLQPLVGASIQFEITDLRFKCGLIFHHTYIEVQPDYGEPQLSLWGKSIDFAQFLCVKEARQRLLQARKIDFSGDLMLLEKLEALIPTLKHLNFDFIKKIVRNRIQYYQEERSSLVSPILMQDFVARLFQIQEQLDRCEVRLNYLSEPMCLQ